MEHVLDAVDRLILDYLKKQKEPKTTYQIQHALKDKVSSWSTAQTHLMKLSAFGYVKHTTEKRLNRVRHLWELAEIAKD